jgi:flagellar biosynthesis GTPase FlhF
LTDPIRCHGRTERHALELAHARCPAGFEIVHWKRSETGTRGGIELAVRPIRPAARRQRARLRLLASVLALRAAAEEAHKPARPDVRLATPVPHAARPERWAFVGVPGSGVTRVVGGLAGRLHGRGGCSIGLISAGDEIHAEPLRRLADATGIPARSAIHAAAVAEIAGSLGHRSLLLVDLQGVGPRDGDRLVAHARTLESLAPTLVCAVVAADADPLSLRRQIEVFTRLGATHAVLSRVDLAASLDPALHVLAESGLSLAWVAHGSTSGGELAPASEAWLERAAVPATVS